MNIIRTTRFLVRLALAGLFGYFGVLAVMDPVGQAAIWIQPWVQDLITPLVPLATMMLIIGVIEIIIAVIMVTGRLMVLGLVAAAFLLIGIIVNLGFNSSVIDISLRDLVILMTVLYLLAQEVDTRN